VRKKKGVKGVSVYYLPWRVLLACLPAGAFAVYLALRDSARERRALFALTAVLARFAIVGSCGGSAGRIRVAVRPAREAGRYPRATGTDRESAPTTTDHPPPP
jgi:hypothetical protein